MDEATNNHSRNAEGQLLIDEANAIIALFTPK
jgi:hypothetical protein